MDSAETVATIRAALDELGVDWAQSGAETFTVTLPGERKLKTECVLQAGPRDVTVHAFVVRQPDENHAAVYKFLLERNLRMRGIAFCVDHLGDVHLVGRLPITALGTAEIDRLLGAVLDASDQNFNRILELGFAEAIRREWEWRTSRGESTANLQAFRRLRRGFGIR